jgi:hypothetical protein
LLLRDFPVWSISAKLFTSMGLRKPKSMVSIGAQCLHVLSILTLWSTVVIIYTTYFNIKRILNSANTVCLYVSYDSHSEQLLFPQTALTSSSFLWRQRYKLNF